MSSLQFLQLLAVLYLLPTSVQLFNQRDVIIENLLVTPKAKNNEECHPWGNVTLEVCTYGVEYHTALTRTEFLCNDMGCLNTVFSRLLAACPDMDTEFLCRLVFPRCTERGKQLPCRKYCRDVLSSCDEGRFYENVCDQMPEQNCDKAVQSVEPEIIATCIKHNYTYCAEVGFDTIPSTNFEHLNNIISRLEEFRSMIDRCDYPVAKFFICGRLLPKCHDDIPMPKQIRPCDEYCGEVEKMCPELSRYHTEEICERYFQTISGEECLHPSNRSLTSLKQRTPEGTNKRPFLPKVRDHFHFCSRESEVNDHPSTCGGCQPYYHKECSVFGFNKTLFPNIWVENVYHGIAKFDLARLAIAAGCSPNVLLYVCSQLFPACEDTGIKKFKPCRSLCEEINKDCSEFIAPQDCHFFDAEPTAGCLSESPNTEICNMSTQVACVNTKHCIPKSSICDMNNDCGDWSDERECECNLASQMMCTMGMCIPKELKCNGVYDCPDESDETDELCGCKPHEVKCRNENRCILSQWVCDGQVDCPQGHDEAHCSKCTGADQWSCVDEGCIRRSGRCDGVPQCKDHSDEMDCLYKNKNDNLLMVRTADSGFISVCSENFDRKMGEKACRKLGFTNVDNLTSVDLKLKTHKFLVHNEGNVSAIFSKGKIVEACPRDQVTIVNCKDKACGNPGLVLPDVNSETSVEGTWPWMASIHYDQEFICGGAIIDDYVVLTSAQCVYHVKDMSKFRVETGFFPTQPSSSQHHSVFNLSFIPPKRQEAKIALIFLLQRIPFNDVIKPLCSPDKTEFFSKADHCYMAGWGQSSCHLKHHRLRHRKLTLPDVATCNSLLLNSTLKHGERCAQFYNGYVDIGVRDTGSPIFCRDFSGEFKFVGVTSPINRCMKTNILKFVDAQHYLDDINDHMAFTFKCANGHKLLRKDWVCNNIDNCGDNSDETQLCDYNFNCTFDDPYLCGYKLYGANATHLTSGGNYANKVYPLFDHTRGNYPGGWISLPRGTYMESPMVRLNKPHCVRFHYHIRKSIQLGAVIFHFDGKVMTPKFDVQRQISYDRWRMGMFDVGPGSLQMFIRSYEDVFSIDDILLLQGTCAGKVCHGEEFECEVKGVRSCLPQTSWCNFINDCDDSIDERQCSAPQYLCDFENGNKCGFIQSDDDAEVSEWVMVDSRQTYKNLRDFSFRNTTGKMLRLKTSNMTLHDEVLMMQIIRINKKPLCQRFYYISHTEATLTVYYMHDMGTVVLQTLNVRPMEKWRRAQVNIPSTFDKLVLFYRLEVPYGNYGEDTSFHIDDVRTVNGFCTCLNKTVRCAREATCIPQSQICDGKVDCADGTDEKECPCQSDEFTCDNKECISKEKLCNFMRDCADGSDEGSICDTRKNVSCDFEEAFMCGYEVERMFQDLAWKRTNKTDSTMAELRNEENKLDDEKEKPNGFYMLAEHTVHRSTSTLVSIPFHSKGQGLSFSFFVFNASPNPNDVSSFLLAIRHMEISDDLTEDLTEDEIVVWSASATDDMTWQTMCISLPKGNMSLVFESTSPDYNNMMVGLDDVMLLPEDC